MMFHVLFFRSTLFMGSVGSLFLSYMGWHSVFIFHGLMALLWACLWRYYLVLPEFELGSIKMVEPSSSERAHLLNVPWETFGRHPAVWFVCCHYHQCHHSHYHCHHHDYMIVWFICPCVCSLRRTAISCGAKCFNNHSESHHQIVDQTTWSNVTLRLNFLYLSLLLECWCFCCCYRCDFIVNLFYCQCWYFFLVLIVYMSFFLLIPFFMY